MIKAPYEDRIEFWKFQHASITFVAANQLCEQIINQKIITGHPLFTSLMTALHILYGRPFKQRAAVRLSEDVVPEEYKDTHEVLKSMRDQIYAHMDVDGMKTIENNYSINKIRVSIKDGDVQFGMTMAFPREAQIEKIRDLTNTLSEKTRYHADKIWRRHFKSSYVPDNDYEVNLSKENDAFLNPLRF